MLAIRQEMPNTAFPALFEEAGFIHHQHPISIAEILGHIRAHVIAHTVNIPTRGVESGSSGALLRRSPLRTRRAPLDAPGSSKP
jgi:hypothetical protein